MEVALELIRELSRNENMMWVVGGGEVVSENDSKGIKEPEVSGGYVTIGATNWHFHIKLDSIDGVQFVEAESHGNMKSYYVRFSKGWEETLARCYFPSPYLDENHKRTPLQEEKLQAFLDMRDRYVDREGIKFVQRPAQPAKTQ
ncbi:MAG: hypothetical protein FJ316_10960 [SAR202 cluster bacterium]|nr:hypothetical protein [SAR202 cluster bacterium]